MGMPPIVSIVGRSESGKTTLLGKLITELKQRGRRVAVIKHTDQAFEFDAANKDSWRFRQAGSVVSAISSAQQLALIKDMERDLEPQDLLQIIGSDFDLVLTEGFKQSHHPKIEVHRGEQGGDLLSPKEQLLAVVTDVPLLREAPQFNPDEAARIADLIEEKVLDQPTSEIDLFLDDRNCTLQRSEQNMLYRTLIAIVTGMGKIEADRSLRISLRRRT
jgi:molybdopterin-guanine dinucleotide biosynthesis protein B